MTTSVVLVHGAWHGAWCFERVLAQLHATPASGRRRRAAGPRRRSRSARDLHGDAARVRAVLDGLDGDCVLLGHSYGGAVITEAGTHPAVRHLVYLCAFALDAGESCMAAAVAESAALDISYEGRPNLAGRDRSARRRDFDRGTRARRPSASSTTATPTRRRGRSPGSGHSRS